MKSGCVIPKEIFDNVDTAFALLPVVIQKLEGKHWWYPPLYF